MFQCGGLLNVSTYAAFLCVETGTETYHSNGGNQTSYNTASKGSTLTIEGFVPATGRITWRVPADVTVAFSPNPIEFGAGDEVVITTTAASRKYSTSIPGKPHRLLEPSGVKRQVDFGVRERKPWATRTQGRMCRCLAMRTDVPSQRLDHKVQMSASPTPACSSGLRLKGSKPSELPLDD